MNAFRSYGEKISVDNRKLQMVYLYYSKNLSYSQIAVIVDRATGTCRIYINQNKDRLQEAISLFEIKNEIEIFFTPNKEQVENASCNPVWLNDISPKDGKTHYAYLIEIFNDFKFRYTKVGYSGNINRRLEDHIKNEKYGSPTGNLIIVHAIYECSDREQAEAMEGIMRKYLKNTGIDDYVNRDRFSEQRVTNELLNVFNQKYQVVLENF